MAISSSSQTPLSGDVAQLQRWAQKMDTTITELSRSVSRLSTLVEKLISLNSLIHP